MADLTIKNPKTVDGAKLTNELIGFASGVTPNRDTLFIHNVTDEVQVMKIYDAHVANIGSDGFPITKENIFQEPIYAPAIHAGDFFVSSPKVHNNPLEAIKEAISEGLKKDKSIAFMVLSIAKGMIYLLDTIDKTEARLKKAKI